MDYNHLFGRAARLLWRHKFMWLLGVAMGVNSLLFSVGWVVVKLSLPRTLFTTWFSQNPALPTEEMLSTLPTAWPAPETMFGYAAAGLTAVFIWSILFWVIFTIAEGALIATVRDAEEGTPVRIGTSLKAGWQWLARFAAVDALVFFPWFLLVFLLMIVGGATLFYTLFRASTPGADMEQAAVAGVGSIICLFPALGVMGIVTSFTIWYRTLAFRDVALLEHGVKTAVRHPIRLIKANMGDVIGVTAILWVVVSVVGGAIAMISFSSAFFIHGGAWPFMLLELTAVFTVALLNGIIVAFQSAVWTIAYQEWAGNVVLSDSIH